MKNNFTWNVGLESVRRVQLDNNHKVKILIQTLENYNKLKKKKKSMWLKHSQ